MRSAPCPYCPGEGFELGTLGRLTHYRCRDCGMQFSDEAAADNDEEIEAFSFNEIEPPAALHASL